MTLKSSLAGLKLGGGKAVIIGDPHTGKSQALLHAMGDFVDSLGGRYITAADSGTGDAEMQAFAQRTRHVVGATPRTLLDGSVASGDPSSPAYGVFVGLKEAVRQRLGRDELTGLKVAIQGVGHVGLGLARHLKAAGAELWVADIFDANVKQAMDELGANVVRPQDIYGLDVDVFAPCAMGGILNEQTLDVLRAPVIAGAANNQLASAEIGVELQRRNQLYAPDYAINAGGIIDVYYQRNGGSAADRCPCERHRRHAARDFRAGRRQWRVHLGDRRPPGARALAGRRRAAGRDAAAAGFMTAHGRSPERAGLR